MLDLCESQCNDKIDRVHDFNEPQWKLKNDVLHNLYNDYTEFHVLSFPGRFFYFYEMYWFLILINKVGVSTRMNNIAWSIFPVWNFSRCDFIGFDQWEYFYGCALASLWRWTIDDSHSICWLLLIGVFAQMSSFHARLINSVYNPVLWLRFIRLFYEVAPSLPTLFPIVQLCQIIKRVRLKGVWENRNIEG